MKNKNEDKRIFRFIAFITIGIVLLVIGIMYSVTQGAAKIELSSFFDMINNYDNTNPKHVLMLQMRIPRVIAAALVGGALAVAGALVQGLTRNPLGDSGLMGISSGAVFVVALNYGFWHMSNYTTTLILAFCGSALTALAVHGLSRIAPGGNSPMKLVLAGATITSLLSALSQGVSIIAGVSQNVSFWTMGSVAGVQWKHILVVAPIMAITFVAAILISSSVTVISMGDDVARSLGTQVEIVRFVGLVLVVLLSGLSVAVAGMISFVGLMIPHFCRYLLGANYRYIIPSSIIYGALLLVLADIGSKTINPPTEIPIGAVVAVIGVPAFLFIARRKKEVPL